MKRLTTEEERELLHECIVKGRKDELAEQYLNLVYETIRKTLILKNVQSTDEDIKELRNEVFLKLFNKDCRKLKQFKEGAGLSLASWIMMITSRSVLDVLRKKGFDSLSWANNRIYHRTRRFVRLEQTFIDPKVNKYADSVTLI